MVVGTLYDEQLSKNKKILAEHEDSDVDSICRTICRNPAQQIAKVAVNRLKLEIIWIKHQDQTM